MAQCASTALAGAVPRQCVRGARSQFGWLGPVPGVVSLPFPPSRPACPALRVAGRPVWVSLTLARWYAIPRGLCVPRARSGCPSGSPLVPFGCVCARAPAASAPPPLGGVACAPRAVPALRAGRAVPLWSVPLRVSCCGPLLRLTCLGGGGPVPVPPYLDWGCAPPVGRVRGVRVPRGGLGGGGAARAPCPPFSAARGACRAGGRSASFPPSAFPGQATKRVSLAPFWSWGACPRYCSGSCSPAILGARSVRRPGALARVRLFPAVGRRLGRGGGPCSGSSRGQGEGGPSPLPRGGGGWRPRGLRAGRGGEGVGVAPRPPCSPSGGRPAVPYPGPPLVVGAHPPGSAFGRGRGAAPGGGGMRGGLWTALLGAPSDLNPPSALPDWAMVMGGSWGARPP